MTLLSPPSFTPPPPSTTKKNHVHSPSNQKNLQTQHSKEEEEPNILDFWEAMSWQIHGLKFFFFPSRPPSLLYHLLLFPLIHPLHHGTVPKKINSQRPSNQKDLQINHFNEKKEIDIQLFFHAKASQLRGEIKFPSRGLWPSSRPVPGPCWQCKSRASKRGQVGQTERTGSAFK